MDSKYTEMMDAIIAAAKEIDLAPEDLAVCLIEGVGLNSPPIYEAIRAFTEEDEVLMR